MRLPQARHHTLAQGGNSTEDQSLTYVRTRTSKRMNRWQRCRNSNHLLSLPVRKERNKRSAVCDAHEHPDAHPHDRPRSHIALRRAHRLRVGRSRAREPAAQAGIRLRARSACRHPDICAVFVDVPYALPDCYTRQPSIETVGAIECRLNYYLSGFIDIAPLRIELNRR